MSDSRPASDPVLLPTFAARGITREIPKYRIADEGMRPDVAYQVIKDELTLDGYSVLNLATFVTTWMDEHGSKLLGESLNKNMVDRDEYPQTADIEQRCLRMVAELWNAPDHENAVGTSTIGSSEACMLGGMAMKWRWRAKREAEGKSTAKPNLIMGANVQVCWHKFCRYWDVEAREVPCEGDRFTLNAEEALKLVDENTIGVVVVMGSTFDGRYEPVEEVSVALDTHQEETGLDIPIHVDGASGGFVAPFLQPDLVWDFRLPRVKSINASGHKYGLVYPGVGWVVFREKEDLPEDISVMDIRMLVKQMQTDENPWKIFHFVGSVDSVRLAAEIQGIPLPEGLEAEADGADGADGGASKSVYDSATEDEEEDEEEEEVMV